MTAQIPPYKVHGYTQTQRIGKFNIHRALIKKFNEKSGVNDENNKILLISMYSF